MVEIQPITEAKVSDFKAIRLRALQEAPYAFGATYAQESQLSDSEWQKRVEGMNGRRGVGYLAMDGENACGIVGAFLDQDEPTRAYLVSMWTAPSHRQQGAGRLLIGEVLNWARRRNAGILLLMVTSNNEPAIRFYERLGFARTGRTQPYPNDPAVVEYEMSRTTAHIP